MCDSDPTAIEYFNKHLERMKSLKQNTEYIEIQSIDDFFNAEQRGKQQCEKDNQID